MSADESHERDARLAVERLRLVTFVAVACGRYSSVTV
jgi:hypothetical protein